MKEKILIIIPARGGSKGIPRKNLRPLNGKPLIEYSINNAVKLCSKYNARVCVSTDDTEIEQAASKLGVELLQRRPDLSQDHVTLDPVIFDSYTQMKRKYGEFTLVVTMQPTSPLLQLESLERAIKLMLGDHIIETVISGVNNTHLSWELLNGEFLPSYEKRLNRQQLSPTYKETGGFLISRSNVISEKNRIGKKVIVFELPKSEAIDIDTFEDWALCEYRLNRKKILFVVEGYHDIGLGHVYNSLAIAHEILDHNVSFLVGRKSQMAFNKIAESNYHVHIQEDRSLADTVIQINPNVVINDILDTSEKYIKHLKEKDIKVICFEDLGEGAKFADLVINAIYPEQELLPNHFFGHKYFIIRSEFIYSDNKIISKKVKNVLITFGGSDPNNLTQTVLTSISIYCRENGINVDVVLGAGYTKFKTLKQFLGIRVHRNIANMSDFMRKADIVFTSAGRTTFEVASVCTPAIVISQNEREQSHFFASSEYGFINLGLAQCISVNRINNEFIKLCENYDKRKYIQNRMMEHDIKGGKRRVLNLIYKIINE